MFNIINIIFNKFEKKIITVEKKTIDLISVVKLKSYYYYYYYYN